jgi:hypothetical protein
MYIYLILKRENRQLFCTLKNVGIAAAAQMIVPVQAPSSLTGRFSREGTGKTKIREKSIRYNLLMQLWKRLYNTVWLSFFCCVLIPRWMGQYVGLPLHMLLGLALLLMTLGNAKRLSALKVPDRLKRISKVTAGFAVFQLVSGMALAGVMHLAPKVPYLLPGLWGIHVVIALAILTQTSSVATAYDMWEEKEFETDPAQSRTEVTQ